MRGHGPVLRRTVLSRGNVHSRANGPSAGRLKRGLAAALSGGADGDALDAPGRVQVNMTVTTDDEDVRKTFEPGCPSNPARLKAIRQIQKAGIQSCITMTPLLLVRDANAFCDSLLETGVQRFIAQTFHFEKGEFVAQTRKQAFEIMAEKLGCPVSQFQPRYVKHYREAFQTLKARLPQLGEGRQGFAPPF